MADTLRASQEGLEIIDLARRKKRWNKQANIWSDQAHTSQATLKRFWQRKPIDRQAFIDICTALGMEWEEVVESQMPEKPTLIPESNLQLLAPDFYVERPAIESCCYETLMQPGSLLRIKALRQMGKTLLLDKIVAQLDLNGYRIVSLSFKLAERRHFSQLAKFLRWFCKMSSRQLQLPSNLEDYWEEDAGSKANCTTYFEEYLLPQADSPLVLCLDDVDLIFSESEIYQDFFALLRFWHERAKSRKLWQRLRLAVAYSTEVYIPLNINQSPFNVGVSVELPEFTPSQVQELAKINGQDWDIHQVEQVMAMVGGHPYLLELAFAHLNSYHNLTLSQLLAMAPTESGIYSDYLRKHLLILEQEPELALAFKKVVRATGTVQLQPTQAYKLDRMGLIKLSGNEAQPRCELYRQYFREYLISQPQVSPQTPASGTILAAIAFTDVVNSTAHMVANQEEMLELLNRDFQIMESICQLYEGKVVKSTGDGLLLYFVSAVKAVACAREIQNTLAQAAATMPATKVLSHRIGIHLGEVFFSGQDVMGTGVNIAARLQKQAKPGGICISETVYQVVKSQLTLHITGSESQQLKGIPDPVNLYHIMP